MIVNIIVIIISSICVVALMYGTLDTLKHLDCIKSLA